MGGRTRGSGSLPGIDSTSMLRIERISKVFRKRVALHELSFDVRRGEIFGLLGHNGAGKSTAFGITLGQVRPDSGEVHVGDHSVQRQRRLALRRIGAIFETPAFYEYLSGWENLRLLVSLTAIPNKSRMMEVVDLVGLTARIRDKVSTYSHGMRQRLALAQALLPEPQLVILDEPSEGLDPEGIREMRNLILRLRSEHGMTVLLSSHLLSEVEQLCDRVAILHQGRMVFCGDWKAAPPQRRFRLEVEDRERAATVLSRLGIAVKGDVISLDDHSDIADVVAALVQSGARVRGVEPIRRSLEDFYLEHAGGDT
jgi:ABC-2 type transport system ATP-binding protein